MGVNSWLSKRVVKQKLCDTKNSAKQNAQKLLPANKRLVPWSYYALTRSPCIFVTKVTRLFSFKYSQTADKLVPSGGQFYLFILLYFVFGA